MPGLDVTIHNERLKLRATALNGCAVTSAAAGFITPLAAVSFGLPTAAGRGVMATTALVMGWLVVAAVLHVVAQRVLGGLRE